MLLDAVREISRVGPGRDNGCHLFSRQRRSLLSVEVLLVLGVVVESQVSFVLAVPVCCWHAQVCALS